MRQRSSTASAASGAEAEANSDSPISPDRAGSKKKKIGKYKIDKGGEVSYKNVKASALSKSLCVRVCVSATVYASSLCKLPLPCEVDILLCSLQALSTCHICIHLSVSCVCVCLFRTRALPLSLFLSLYTSIHYIPMPANFQYIVCSDIQMRCCDWDDGRDSMTRRACIRSTDNWEFGRT